MPDINEVIDHMTFLHIDYTVHCCILVFHFSSLVNSLWLLFDRFKCNNFLLMMTLVLSIKVIVYILSHGLMLDVFRLDIRNFVNQRPH